MQLIKRQTPDYTHTPTHIPSTHTRTHAISLSLTHTQALEKLVLDDDMQLALEPSATSNIATNTKPNNSKPKDSRPSSSDRVVDWMSFVERFRLATTHEALVLRELQVIPYRNTEVQKYTDIEIHVQILTDIDMQTSMIRQYLTVETQATDRTCANCKLYHIEIDAHIPTDTDTQTTQQNTPIDKNLRELQDPALRAAINGVYVHRQVLRDAGAAAGSSGAWDSCAVLLKDACHLSDAQSLRLQSWALSRDDSEGGGGGSGSSSSAGRNPLPDVMALAEEAVLVDVGGL